MRNCLFGLTAVLSVAILAGVAFADEKDPPKAKTDPKGVPLELKIVAKKDKYTLDLGGKSADDFKKAIKEGEKTGKLEAAPTVDLVLEIKNTGTKELKVWVGGDPTKLTLALEGPGVETATFSGPMTLEFRLPKTITVAAGKTHEIPLASLTYGNRNTSRAYWIKPGDYTITANYATAVSPQPEGSQKAGEEGFGLVTLSSAPVKVKVEEKK